MKYSSSVPILIGLAVLPGLAEESQNAVSPKPISRAIWLPAEALNQELPRWLRFSGEERLRWEGFLGGGFTANSDDLYLLNRFRFTMNVAPQPWLKFQFQTQDARVFFKTALPYGPPYQSTLDLRLANVQFGDNETHPVSVRFGRQELSFGEERLIGVSNWSNTTRTFDAARATFRYKHLKLDAFAASVVSLRDGRVGDHLPGNNIHGLYGQYMEPVTKAVIEPYFFWRLNQRLKTETGRLGDLDFTTTGVRTTGKLPAGFDYNTDVALERGSLGIDRIAAWAGHWLLGRSFKRRAAPRWSAEYNFASGDANAQDGVRGAFDQLYNAAHDRYGLADLVGWKNIHHLRTVLDIRPSKRIASGVKWNAYWLADSHDALYSANSTPLARKADGSAGRYVGHGLDFTFAYAFSTRLQAGVGLAHMFPGTFLKLATPGNGYTTPYLLISTTF